MNYIDIARCNMRLAGMDEEDIDIAADICLKSVKSIYFADESSVLDAYERDLQRILSHYELTVDLRAGLTLEQAADFVTHNSEPGTYFGLTGCPASGKSTLLRQLQERDGYLILDEFWDENDKYDDEQEQAQDAIHDGKIVVVAAPLLDERVETRLHLYSPPDVRKLNLEVRNRESDRLRAKHWSLLQKVDFFLYELECGKAQEIVDTSSLRY